MRQRLIAAVWAGEQFERQCAIEYWFEDEVPSEKAMTERERMVKTLEMLIQSVKDGQEIYIREPDEHHEVSWEQSAEDTEKGIENASKKK